jgi:cytochrome c oxidase cbb3-type subunit III
MAQFEDKVLHDVDGIREYDNPMPGWLMAIWWGSLIFSAAYLIFYALSFGEGSMEAEYRGETQKALASVQAHFDANPLVPPSTAELLAGATSPAVLQVAAARFAKSCAACHGEKAQGLIGPNLTDDRWLHGGSVEQIFQTIAKGWPAKGMPPWGRALKPEELAALVSYIRSLQGSSPPNARPPEGDPVAPQPIAPRS